jgi:hypothetical protein
MEKISFKEGITRLKKDSKLEGVTMEEDFDWRQIVDSEDEVLSDLVFLDCFFGGYFGFYAATCRGKIHIENCIFNQRFEFFNVFAYQHFEMRSCIVKGTASLSDGAFYQSLTLSDNIFEGFADFEDADIQGQATLINNHFNGGTNFKHPKGGPWGAQCAKPPHLEGNTGLERYEGSAKTIR